MERSRVAAHPWLAVRVEAACRFFPALDFRPLVVDAAVGQPGAAAQPVF